MEYIGDYVVGSDNLIRYIRDELSQMPTIQRRQVIFNIFWELSKALEYIHELGYVHRDIRPENLFIQKPNIFNQNTFKAILGDFGMSKNIKVDVDMESGLPILNKQPSKFNEQVQRHSYNPYETRTTYDSYSDIYNLGLVLYDMVSGDIKRQNRINNQIQYLNNGKIPKREILVQNYPVEIKVIELIIDLDLSSQSQTQRMKYLSLYQEWKDSINPDQDNLESNH